ncbi:MAG: metallopeptidase family protein [Novosphingobium sp.]|nr:metallopeptidase family protein [Novosphingobium sp.]
MNHRIGHAPDAATFEKLARAAFARIPEPFARHLSDIVIRVEDFADDETLDALGIEDAWGLSGLYHGRPLDEQSVWSSGDMPPTITLYRMPLLAEWTETHVTLEALVSHVVIHEVGHHFGLSDAEMHAIEQEGD